MLQQRLPVQTVQSSQSALQSASNRQASFLEQLRLCLQRPTIWEKCRDLTKILTQALYNIQQNQGLMFTMTKIDYRTNFIRHAFYSVRLLNKIKTSQTK